MRYSLRSCSCSFARRRSLFISGIIALAAAGAGCGGTSRGESLYHQANQLYERAEFTQAEAVYWQAMPILQAEGHLADAADCRTKAQNGQMFKATFAVSESDLRQLLDQTFPGVPQDQKDQWIAGGALEHMTIDGATKYFGDVANLAYRDQDLFNTQSDMVARYRGLLDKVLNQILPGTAAVAGQPYVNPATFSGHATLPITRSSLPAAGTLKLWLPIPIVTGPQPSVTVTSAEPAAYVKAAPSTDQDLGDVYLEIPLDGLQQDLQVSVDFTFTHHEQRFVIDPASVGSYDTSDPVYQKYTASAGNVAITPEITAAAQAIVGDETNPYLAARALYYWIVKNVKYSHMPHGALWPRGQAESLYVHERHYGDCGAQSIYFAALARSLGIPARAAGGFQLLEGTFGSHFWAEFYLPNYGWVPVDTSVGALPEMLADVTEQDKQAFEDFFFANQDNLRCVVQNDVDEALVPAAASRVALPIVLQMPAANCDSMQELPEIALWDHWQLALVP